ncbi:hypothetical protein CHUAL_002986 [Chamberlinius hualienensis]
MSPTSSIVWKYFSKLNKTEVRCNFCTKRLKTGGGTTNLRQHLNHKHPNFKNEQPTYKDEQNPSDGETEETTATDIIPITTTKRTKKRSFNESNDYCGSQHMDEFSIAGENIANKLRKLPPGKMMIVEKLITDIIFEAQCGNIDSFTRINVIDMRSEEYPQTVTVHEVDS